MLKKYVLHTVKGFTLIELIVTVAIIGILAAGALAAINPKARIDEANEATAKRNVLNVGSAMEACFAKNQGDWTKCDSWTELQTGNFIRNTMTSVAIGSTATTTDDCTAGKCCSWSANGTVCYWYYSSSSGSVNYQATSTCN